METQVIRFCATVHLNRMLKFVLIDDVLLFFLYKAVLLCLVASPSF
jgi:hypothetical protein